MDVLYEDLENYEDVNAIDELKTENQELKLKLEDYARSMDRLQKEFDKLSSEFKRLETNYSSLLKTAKAEIERKAQMIFNLNKEKDALVCSTLQRRNKPGHKHKNNNKADGKPNKLLNINASKPENVREPNEPKDRDSGFDNQRKEFLISEDTKSSSSRETSNKLKNPNTRVSASSEVHTNTKGRGDYKENVEERLHRPDNMAAVAFPLGIQHRRKSMPIFNENIKLSSDEEFEQLYSAEESNVKNMPKYRDFNKGPYNMVPPTNSFDRTYEERNRPSDYEYRKSKCSRFYNYDKNRGRDRYERPHYNTRPYSPDRYIRRDKEYRDTYQRADYTRNRFLKSPPPDKYHKEFKNWQQNVSQEYRNLNNQLPERNVPKHKLPCGYDEPHSKRIKIDSYSKRGNLKSQKEDHQGKEELIIDSMRYLQPSTCQSPDFLPAPDSSMSVREIPNDVSIETKQEDPRRQKINLNKGEHIEKLNSSSGLQVIDRKKWSSAQVPDALITKPLSEEIYKDIYDFDLSLESEDDSESEISDMPWVDDKNKKNTISDETTRDVDESKREQPKNDALIKNSLSTKYKIPKLNKPSDTPNTSKLFNERQNIVLDVKKSSVNIQKHTIDSSTKSGTHSASKHCQDKVQQFSSENVDHSTLETSQNSISNKVSTLIVPDKTLKLDPVSKTLKDTVKELNPGSIKESMSVDLKQSVQKSADESISDGLKLVDEVNTRNSLLADNDKPTSNCDGKLLLDVVQKQPIVVKIAQPITDKNKVVLNKDKTQCSTPNTQKEIGDVPKTAPDKSKLSPLNTVKKPPELSKKKSKETTNKSVKDKVSKNSTVKDEGHKINISGKDKKAMSKSKNKKELDKKLVEGDLEMSDSDYETNQEKNKKITLKNNQPEQKSSKNSTSVTKNSTRDSEELNNKTHLCKTNRTVKSKFTDLFGDSSSLITPEDLEIPITNIQTNSDEFFENAVDMNVEDMIKVQSRVAHTTTAIDANVENVNMQKEKSSVSNSVNDVTLKPFQKDSENDGGVNTEVPLQSEDTKSETILPTEDGIVKTIIISTGVQNNREQNVPLCDLDSVTVLNDPNSEVKAFATSTPERQQEFKVKEICDENKKIFTIPKVAVTIDDPEPLDTILHHGQPEPDIHLLNAFDSKDTQEFNASDNVDEPLQKGAPDVRIFIKRRKRVIKKPTSSLT